MINDGHNTLNHARRAGWSSSTVDNDHVIKHRSITSKRGRRRRRKDIVDMEYGVNKEGDEANGEARMTEIGSWFIRGHDFYDR